MADKNIQMQKKLANGSYDNYFPITKAANVKTTDGKDLQTLITAKVDKPASATSGNIAVFDGGAGKLKDGGPLDTFLLPYRATGVHTVEIAPVPAKSSGQDYYINLGAPYKSISLLINAGSSITYVDQALFGLPIGGGDGALSFDTGGNNSNRWQWQQPKSGGYVKYVGDIALVTSEKLLGQLLPDGRLRFYGHNSTSNDRGSETYTIRWWAR